MPEEVNTAQAVNRGLQFVGEAFLPGGSHLVKGDLMNGAIYAALGLAAKAVFGLPGLLAVSANSFTKARTGLSLLEHFQQVAEGQSGPSVETRPVDPRPAPPLAVEPTPTSKK